MRAVWVLLLHSLRRVRTITLTIGLLLALLQVVLTLVATSIDKTGQFATLGLLMPDFMKQLLGPAVASFLSFAGIVSLGYFDPPVLVAIIGLTITVATQIAFEVESGFLDVVLARPIARHWIVTRSIAVNLVAITVVILCMVAGTSVGLKYIAPPIAELPTPLLVFRLAANLWMQCVAWSAIAMALAASARRRGVAGGIAGVLALVAFLLDYIARLWDAAKAVVWLSPFAYFKPLDLVMGDGLSAKHMLVLGGITLAGWTLAYTIFLRRDISR